jgi:uncharacterized Ntn-hydrolase superfamily protein
MTYSILARDPETGAFGVGVQSHAFTVGPVVGWVEPGIGGVATQAFVNVGLGPQGLDLLRDGHSAADTLSALVGGDDQPAIRQVAVVDAQGRVAAHTGDRCIPAAGSRAGDQVIAQGNMLASDEVYRSMIDAYAQSTAAFPERILAALRAAEDHGGDSRGSQSAALRVVSGTRSTTPWKEVLMDLRVDDHRDPIGELSRLVGLDRAYERMNGAWAAPGLLLGEFEAVPERDVETALAALDEAQKAVGGDVEPSFWKGVLLARAGRMEEARSLFAELYTVEPKLRGLVQALGQVGFLDASAVTAL